MLNLAAFVVRNSQLGISEAILNFNDARFDIAGAFADDLEKLASNTF